MQDMSFSGGSLCQFRVSTHISRASLTLLNFTFVLLAWSSSGNRSKTLTEDEHLVMEVRRAVQDKVPGESIESTVRIKPSMSSLRAMERSALLRTDVMADPDRQEGVPYFSKMQNVVYWIRPTRSEDPRVIGIAWTHAGESNVFFGILLPPRLGRQGQSELHANVATLRLEASESE
jgi:hypothetical protein